MAESKTRFGALPTPAKCVDEESWQVEVDSEGDDKNVWSGHPDGSRKENAPAFVEKEPLDLILALELELDDGSGLHEFEVTEKGDYPVGVRCC